MKKLTLKNLNWYKIFMASMMIATLAIAIWVGVSAVQKSMKMKIGFVTNPTVLTQVYVDQEGENDVLIFQNYGDVEVNYAELTSNSLVLSSEFINNFGTEFTLKIFNRTNDTPISIIATSTAVVNGSNANGAPAEITPAVQRIAYNSSETFKISASAVMQQQTTINFEFTTEMAYNVDVQTENCSVVEEVPAYIKQNQPFTQTFVAPEGYILPDTITVTGVEEGGYSWDSSTGDFAITDWTKVTGNISISCVAKLPYTIKTYSASDSIRPSYVANSYYKYYVEMGEYPQSYYAATIDGVAGADGTTTTLNGERYYYQNDGWYKIEPVRWIVVGGLTDTAYNSDPATSATPFDPAKTLEHNASNNTFIYNGTTYQNVLLVAEQALVSSRYDADSAGKEWQETDIYNCLVSLQSKLFTEEQGNLILDTTLKTGYRILDVTSNRPATILSIATSTGNKLFLLAYGSTDSTFSYASGYENENYKVADYFTDTTSRCATSTSGNSSSWWLRSGAGTYNDNAFFVKINGDIYAPETDNCTFAVRPSFVLNLGA